MKAAFACVAVGLWVAACSSGSAQQRKDDGPEQQRGTSRKKAPEPETWFGGPVVAVDGKVPAEADLDRKLTAPRAELEAEMQHVVGRSARPLVRGKPEGLMGNFMADVMREAASESTGKPVDVAFTNSGGVRADLPGGDLTRGAVLEVMPFDNTLVVVELKGSDLQEVFNRSATHGGDPFSGASFTVKDKKAVGVMVGGAPLDPARTYRLCTSDYILDGGGKYDALKKATNINRTGILIRDAMMHHIEKEAAAGRAVDSTIGGRILGVGKEQQP